jgi:hypothetical protein
VAGTVAHFPVLRKAMNALPKDQLLLGRGFALGAMHAVWDKARSAREVALAGVHAGCEFDRSSAGPVDILHDQTENMKAGRAPPAWRHT